MPLTVLGRLTDEGSNMTKFLLKRTTGGLLKVKDVGYSKTGAKSEDIVGYLDGKPSINVAVFSFPMPTRWKPPTAFATRWKS